MPKSPSTNCPADSATRCWLNSGPIRAFTSRSDDAHSSKVVSTDAPAIYDLPNHAGLWIQKFEQNATVMLGGQFVQQRLGLLEVNSVKAFGEPNLMTEQMRIHRLRGARFSPKSGSRIPSVSSSENSPIKRAFELGAAKCQEILYHPAIKKNPVRVLVPLLEFNHIGERHPKLISQQQAEIVRMFSKNDMADPYTTCPLSVQRSTISMLMARVHTGSCVAQAKQPMNRRPAR